MKLFRIIGRSIRDSFNSIFRNFAFSFASIFCIMITLFMVAISALLAVNIDSLSEKIKKDVTIVAFLDRDVTEERILEIEEIVKGMDNVSQKEGDVLVKSKDEIRKEWMESSKTYENIMRDWETREDNALQDTIEIKVVDIKLINKTAEEIEKIEGVELAKYGEGMVEQLVTVLEMIKNGSFIIVLALIVVAFFLIANTIKITIFSRKREIDIMRLVGASNINIKIPFFFEGLFIGIFGSLIPIFATMYGYTVLYNNTNNGELFGKIFTLVEPTPVVYNISIMLLIIGAVVGIIGSVGAVRKHLKI